MRDQKPGFGGRQGEAGHEGKAPQSRTDIVEGRARNQGKSRAGVGRRLIGRTPAKKKKRA